MKIKNITLIRKRSDYNNAISLITGGSFTIPVLEVELDKSNLIQAYLDNCEKVYWEAINYLKKNNPNLDSSEWYLLKFEY